MKIGSHNEWVIKSWKSDYLNNSFSLLLKFSSPLHKERDLISRALSYC